MTVDAPLATVVICTRNRADSLARTLASISAAAERVKDQWELLIVDNGGTDHTANIVSDYGKRLPIRRVWQPIPGLSNARNAAIPEARGRFFIWTDDDVLVDGDWLAAYLSAFRKHPECGVFGGRAVPRYEEPSVAWFRSLEGDLGSLLAIRDHPEWKEITPERVPFGLNYAVRSDIQRTHPYDPSLGVAPGRRLGGEETTMIRGALAAGARGRWVWDATVYHLIPRERQSARYIFSYYRALGQSFPRLPDTTRLAQRGTILSRLARKATTTAARRAIGDDAWIRSYIDLARSVGSLDRIAGSSAKPTGPDAS